MIWSALFLVGAMAVLYSVAMLLVAVASVRPPRVPVVLSPGLLGVASEPVVLRTEDGKKVKAWWIEGDGDLVVVCVHGYLMNRAEFVPLLPMFQELGAGALLPDLRGHGGSDRGPITFGLHEQAEVRACLAEVRRRSPNARIVLFGSSMGAAASCLALEREPGLADAFIADSMYARLSEASEGWWTFFLRGRLGPVMRPANWIGAWITGVRPSQVSTLGGLRALAGKPVLLVFGEHDPLVPPESRKAMLDAAGALAEIVTVPQGSHGDGRLREPEMYRDAVRAFLAGIARDPARMRKDDCAPAG